MPRTAARRRPRAPRLAPEERKASLVEAGIHVLAREGIGAARPGEVAREAGVSEATVYVYFSTRDALVEAVLEEVGRHYEALTEAALEAEAPLRERMAALLQATADSVEAEPDRARVWFNWGSAVRGKLWPRFLTAEARLTRRIAAALRRASAEERAACRLHPDDLARLLIGMAEAIGRMKFAGRPPREVRRFIRSTLAALFPEPAPGP